MIGLHVEVNQPFNVGREIAAFFLCPTKAGFVKMLVDADGGVDLA